MSEEIEKSKHESDFFEALKAFRTPAYEREDNEHPEYDPTTHELLQLVGYWKDAAIKAETALPSPSSSGEHANTYALRRIERISELLGEDSVRTIVSKVENEYRARVGDRRWRILREGNEKQRKRLDDERVFAAVHGLPLEPGCVAFLAQMAVLTYPELARQEVAIALMHAALTVAAGGTKRTPCAHQWEGDSTKSVQLDADFVSIFEYCDICDARRWRRVYCDEAEYAEHMPSD